MLDYPGDSIYFYSSIREAERANKKETRIQINKLLSWAAYFDTADIGTKRMIVARLVKRVEVSTGV